MSKGGVRTAQNLELIRHLNPDLFDAEFPDTLTGCLDAGWAVTCKFNRNGNLLASGCNDGRVFVWDFEAKTVALCLIHHTRTVTALDWSRDGRMLLTAATDCKVCLWDLAAKRAEYKPRTEVRFGSRVLCAQLHPEKEHICVVGFSMEVPVLLDLSSGEQRALPVGTVSETRASSMKAVFSVSGSEIYVSGDDRGEVTVIDTETLQVLRRFDVCAASVKSLYVHASGKTLLCMCSDKTVRLMDIDAGAELAQFLDPIDRPEWKCAMISPSGDMVAAGTVKGQQRIYGWTWGSEGSNLTNLLYPGSGGNSGTAGASNKEGVMHCEWHPSSPSIVAVSTRGVIYVWSRSVNEKWSAYLPEFTELVQNSHYVEAEDFFDVVDEVERQRRREVIEANMEEEVEIMSDGDHDGAEDEFHLPLLLDRIPTGVVAAGPGASPPPAPKSQSQSKPAVGTGLGLGLGSVSEPAAKPEPGVGKVRDDVVVGGTATDMGGDVGMEIDSAVAAGKRLSGQIKRKLVPEREADAEAGGGGDLKVVVVVPLVESPLRVGQAESEREAEIRVTLDVDTVRK